MPRHRNALVCLGLAAVVLLGLPLQATAQDPSPEAAYRQSLMQGFRLHTGAIRAVLSGAAPIGHAEHHAVAFERLATALANTFPEGSHGPGSRALPAIWERRTEFMNLISGVQSAAASLVTAAGSGDEARIRTALSGVTGTCSGCHQAFRSR